jgi:IS5 family transposase
MMMTRDDDEGDSNGWADFSGKKRSNETHESKTDPDSRLARKGPGKEARLSFALNVLNEDRNGLIVNLHSTIATGRAEIDGATELVDGTVAPMKERATIGADKGYDARYVRDELLDRGRRPHIALRNDPRQRLLLDKRTTDSVGYQLSQILRRKMEGIIGWLKHPGRMKRARLRGLARVNHLTYLAGTASSLLRIANLSRRQATVG